jgi:hypothetical protein
MIAIDQVLVSDEIVEEQFVCNLSRCKGGCCEDGDAGAPLEKAELAELDNVYEKIEPYMTAAGRNEVKRSGRYFYDRSFGWVTPIEQAYLDGKIQWKKPISCHLFPIRIKKSRKDPDIEYLNYEPREDLCQSACSLGKELKVPVYTFVKDALIRKYGADFYEALTAAAERLNEGKKSS